MINDSIYLWKRTSNLSGKYSILHFQTFSPFVSKSWILRVCDIHFQLSYFFCTKEAFYQRNSKAWRNKSYHKSLLQESADLLVDQEMELKWLFFVFFFFCNDFNVGICKKCTYFIKKIWGKKCVHKLMRLITFWDPVYFSMGANYLA